MGWENLTLPNSIPFFSSEAPLFLLVSTFTKPVRRGRRWAKMNFCDVTKPPAIPPFLCVQKSHILWTWSTSAVDSSLPPFCSLMKRSKISALGPCHHHHNMTVIGSVHKMIDKNMTFVTKRRHQHGHQHDDDITVVAVIIAINDRHQTVLMIVIMGKH